MEADPWCGNADSPALEIAIVRVPGKSSAGIDGKARIPRVRPGPRCQCPHGGADTDPDRLAVLVFLMHDHARDCQDNHGQDGNGDE